MFRYILRRLRVSALMLILVSVIVFIVLRLLPGDPTIAKVGAAQNIDPAALAELRERLGLNDPILVQYWNWIVGLVQGDLGQSYFSEFSVGTMIAQRVWPTLTLMVAGLVLAIVFALVLGTLPTIVRNRWFGGFVNGYTTVGMAAPPFVFGLLLVAVFTVELGLFPTRGYVPITEDPVEGLRALAMPALTLGFALSAPLIRYLRSSLNEVESATFVRTATGKGIRHSSVVWQHILPNALLPALTSLGITVGQLIGGMVVVEYVFRWPGFGSLIVDSVFKRDYAVLQTTALLAAAVFVVVNLVVDITYGLLDPRLRVSKPGRST